MIFSSDFVHAGALSLLETGSWVSEVSSWRWSHGDSIGESNDGVTLGDLMKEAAI